MTRLLLICMAVISFQGQAYAQSPTGDHKVKITEPDGVPLQPILKPDKYLRERPFCFEWQYVHVDNDVDNYYNTQVINGIVTKIPPASYNWSVSAGVLSDKKTASPKYKPTQMPLPDTRTDVALKLRAYPDNDQYMDKKTLEVYRDHLERDYQNFKNAGSCGAPKFPDSCWSFTRYGIKWPVRKRWNCFGSVWHAYNGSEAYSTTIPSFQLIWAWYEPIAWADIESRAQRGDVIAYHIRDKSGSIVFPAAHVATFLNSTTTFGANNEPLFQFWSHVDECGRHNFWHGTSWRWYETTPQNYYDTINQTWGDYQASIHNPREILVEYIELWRKK